MQLLEAKLFPPAFNHGQLVTVYALHVDVYELAKHWAFDLPSFDGLDPQVTENVLAKVDDFLDELGSKLLQLHLVQVLQ